MICDRGVFAKEKIIMGETIAIWGGKIYSAEEIDSLSKKYPSISTHPFGVFDGFYMGPVKPDDPPDDAEFFNHSCLPNAGIKGQIVLIARRDIPAGEEICFDYETTENTSNALGFKCNCKSNKCREMINGDAWLDPNFIRANKEYLSWYILCKVNNL